MCFLTEVDSKLIDENYQLLGYKAFSYEKETPFSKTRILALIKNEIVDDIKQRIDLQIKNYPVISFELNLKDQKNVIIIGVYRIWTNNQNNEFTNLTELYDKACNEEKEVLILGDMNLNKIKFDELNYPYKFMRDNLLDCLSSNDMKMVDLPQHTIQDQMVVNQRLTMCITQH